MIIGILSACAGGPPPGAISTGTADTSVADTALDTGSTTLPPATLAPYSATWTTCCFEQSWGHAMAAPRFATAADAVVAVSAPSVEIPGGGEDASVSKVMLIGPPFSGHHDDFVQWISGEVPLGGGWSENLRLGADLLAPGDVTGDGIEDLVAFDDGRDSALPVTTFLFPGPLASRVGQWGVPWRVTDPDVIGVAGPEPSHGARCGDLDGDGVDDLCVTVGVFFGPVQAGAEPGVTWSAALPTEEVRLAGADLDGDGLGELLLWDPAADALRWHTSFPPGDLVFMNAAASWTAQRPATLTALAAGADLDGDGGQDFVVALDEGGRRRLYVVTDHAGGPLAGAYATLDHRADALALGDLDGDGAAELVVGVGSSVLVFRGPLAPGPLTATSAAAHWHGLFPEPGPHATEPSGRGKDGDAFGRSLLAVDLDLDGRSELFVGAPDEGIHETPFRPVGRVYLIPGGSL